MSDEQTGIEITALEYKEWKRSKVTKYVVEQLNGLRQIKTNGVMSGQTLAPDAGENSTAYNIGFAAGLSMFLDMQYDDSDKAKPVSEYEH